MKSFVKFIINLPPKKIAIVIGGSTENSTLKLYEEAALSNLSAKLQ